jgi:hypothetical protein
MCRKATVAGSDQALRAALSRAFSVQHSCSERRTSLGSTDTRIKENENSQKFTFRRAQRAAKQFTGDPTLLETSVGPWQACLFATHRTTTTTTSHINIQHRFWVRSAVTAQHKAHHSRVIGHFYRSAFCGGPPPGAAPMRHSCLPEQKQELPICAPCTTFQLQCRCRQARRRLPLGQHRPHSQHGSREMKHLRELPLLLRPPNPHTAKAVPWLLVQPILL